MIIEIPFKTPTVNHLYGQRPGGFGRTRFIKPEARKIREKIKEICSKVPIGSLGHFDRLKLKVEVQIYENWFCKNLSVKRKDIVNREKFLIDSVFDALGLDDKLIFIHIMRKIQSTEEKAIITIEALK